MTEIAFYHVDAFTDVAFGGNPAGICPLDAWLPSETMQAIAFENNLSETAFFVANATGYHLRWFTPKIEVSLCGHATLASAYVIARHINPGVEKVLFDSASGPLLVTRRGEVFTLDFPVSRPEPFDDKGAVFEALGVQPQAVLKAGKMMAVLADETAVRDVEPHLERVSRLPADGLIVTAPGDDCDFVSRFFAPHAGIPEDPVTGSAHCVLTPYWAERLGKTVMEARQISARGGKLTVEDRGERVLLSGRVTPYLEGRIRV
ncbi:PhzF family phenazine biosynthesis protein [Pelagibius litoralis]|uniref:PhzF family phenazine biosynthesis protein n=1 Tax=Pelagibius litoralis TaxID=374515 RepID=A0A967EZY4_9PROT|nr:PhzF family phenazine biosynthesis protein [Pelagibius litoralis]NIA70480.1 PhzF family phenazine biosynthesis protein [Pelagibius litoralis]